MKSNGGGTAGRDRLVAALAVAGFVGGWEAAARLGWISTLFFPAPSVILTVTARRLASGELLRETGATSARVLAGFLLGALPGMVLGVAMGRSRRLRAAVDPFVAAAHPVPKIALFPLIMIIFGIGEMSKVVVVALAAFFPMLVNSMAGVRNLSPVFDDVARNCGAGRGTILARVVIPGSLPMILAGARVGLNLAFLVTISTELVAARTGLGARIWFAWETFRTEELYACILVISLLGALSNQLLQHLSRWLAPWQAELER